MKYANKVAFIDTDFVSTQAFCLKYEGREHPFVQALIDEYRFDLVILLENNTPWVADGLRSLGSSVDRKEFQSLLVSLLKENEIEFVHVKESDYDARFLRCVELVKQLMGEQVLQGCCLHPNPSPRWEREQTLKRQLALPFCVYFAIRLYLIRFGSMRVGAESAFVLFVLGKSYLRRTHLTFILGNPEWGGDTVKEPAVVRDNHRAARELQQGVFQRAVVSISVVVGSSSSRTLPPTSQQLRRADDHVHWDSSQRLPRSTPLKLKGPT